MVIEDRDRCFADGLDNCFIQELIKEIAAIKGVVGLFLAGSAAQKELLWWGNKDSKILLSDIEAGVVTSDFFLRRKVRNIASKLSRNYGYEVELFLVTPRRLQNGSPKNLSFRLHHPNLIMFDITTGAHWLYKSNEIVKRRFISSDLPAWEGVRLILNRYAEGAIYLMPWFDQGIIVDQPSFERWVVKLLLALGDALLIQSGNYVCGYGKRLAIWRKQCHIFEMGEDFNGLVLAAYGVREGKEFPFNQLEPQEIFAASRKVFLFILAQHFKDKSLTNKSLNNLSDWCSSFREKPVPLRFQAPIKQLDGFYDSAHLLPGLYRSQFSLSVLFQLLKHRVPFQVFAYGIIALELVSEKTNNKGWIKELFMDPTSQSNANKYELLKDLWDVFCK